MRRIRHGPTAQQMKIVVAGDNSIARDLALGLRNDAALDIVLIDADADALREIREGYDVHTIQGRPSSLRTLREADLQPDDIFISLSRRDEVNLVACRLVNDLVGREVQTVSRLNDQNLIEQVRANRENFGVDRVLCPEQLVTEHLERLIEHPGAFQYIEFHDHQSCLVGVKALSTGKLVGRQLKELPTLMPDVDMRVAAIYRPGAPIIPEGETRVVLGDDLFLLMEPRHVEHAIEFIHDREKRNRRVMIAGGGNIGLRLAKALQDEYQVKIIETDAQRCSHISEQLDDAIVLRGNASDRKLLDSEYISDIDVFCAVTNDDEANFLASLVAKRLGAHHVIAIINNPTYMELVEGESLDVVVSPAMLTSSSLMSMIRPGLAEGYSLRRGAAEVVKILLPQGSRWINTKVGDLGLPEYATLGAVLRNSTMLVATRELTLMEGDSLVLFVADRERVRKVEHSFDLS